MNERFNAVERHFDDVNKRFDGTNKKFTMMFTFLSIIFVAVTGLMSLYQFLGR